jgi:ATP-dependent helicase/nuclease subunit A
MDKSLPDDDRQARIDALDVTRSFIVQAPAGSGKTELLIQRYLKLLATVEQPEEIVAITFTRKAAAEMQFRVLDALRRRRNADEPTEDHERVTYELAGHALDRSARKGWNLPGNPRRLKILTLDALNASIARTQPISSRGARARIVVGAQLQAIHRSAALATLDWLGEKGEMQAAVEDVLRHVDNNTWLYASYLSQMLGTRDQWLPFIGSGSLSDDDAENLRRQFEQAISFAVTDQLQRTAAGLARAVDSDFCELLKLAANNLLDSALLSSPIARLAGLAELPKPVAEELPYWQGIAELLMTQKGEFRKRVDKRQGFPPGDKESKNAMQGLLESLATNFKLADSLHGIQFLPPVHYSNEQWRVLLALFRLLPLAVTELKRLFNEQGVADHIDVALTADAALGSAENPGDVALLLDHHVKHMLVDEMQDTSAAQYRMLETLTGGWQAGDGRTLYCVGDPMQSIYRFRNAEVGQFLLAREHGIGQINVEPLLLRRNFRSGEWLVDWFNTVFPTILAADDDPLRGAVSYSEAVPVEHLRGQGNCVTHAIFGSDVNEEAVAACRVIADTLNSNADDDMAVLVRGRSQLPRLLAQLRANGIPYRAVDIDRLTDLPEIIDVLALTRAAAHQGDRIAWLAILRSPWIGLDWQDLHALVKNDVRSTVWELIGDDERLATMSAFGRQAVIRTRDSLAMLTLPRRSQSLRDLVERVWLALGGPGILEDDYAVDNIYRYFEVLGKLEFAGTLIDIGDLESTLDLELVSNTGSARLQIMTMHRAKGLQFDHVLLFGLGRQSGKGTRRVLSWFDMPGEHGVQRKVISPVGPRAEIDNDPVHRYIELSEANKNRHELARLLYVACTRAKKSLHLMGNTAISTDGEEFKAARGDSLLHLLWPAVEPEFARQFSESSRTSEDGDSSVWANPVLRRFATPWQLPDVELLPGESPKNEILEPKDEVEFYWVGSDTRIAGTLVHRWLKLIADEQTSNQIIDEQKLQIVSSRWLKEAGLVGDAAKPIIDRVVGAVTSMMQDSKGRWILDGPGHAEFGLTGVFDGDLVSVILDRVRIDEEGTHWIIDYKTSTHEGGNLDGFLQVEADRYRPQLARYASIYADWANEKTKCALYFPVLKSFVEVTV